MSQAPSEKAIVLGVGVALNALAADFATVSPDGSCCVSIGGMPNPIPPAIVLGELFGEKPEVDVGSPPSIRGTGLPWPPSATVTSDGSARFPMALAWPLLEHASGAAWKWRTAANRVMTSEPSDAIAEAAVATIAAAAATSSEHPITCIVPNTLSIDAQDDLLRSLGIRGVKAHLLWRPIAAALVWANKYGSAILNDYSHDDAPIGTLWVTHLGVDAFELTRLELIPVSVNGRRFLLPARRLASLPTLYGEGLRWAEYLADHATAEHADDGSAAWNLLWTTEWLTQLIRRLAFAKTEGQKAQCSFPLHSRDVLDRGIAGWRLLVSRLQRSGVNRNATDVAASVGSSLRRCFAPIAGPYRQPALAQTAGEADFSGWLDHIRRLPSGNLPVLGLVGTGAFAAVRSGDETLADFALGAVSGKDPTQDTIVEGRDDAGAQILARGAAIYGYRRAHHLPAYLDMLPKLELQIQKFGEPVFQDILETEGDFVPGGVPYRAEPQNLNLHVPQEQTDLVLPVLLEGHETVHAATTVFPKAVSHTTPVTLQIRMLSGQGNPRVEVKPDDSSVFGGRRVYLDWRRAEDTGLTRDEYLGQVPRTNPPRERRLASLTAWRGGVWGYEYRCDGALGAVKDLVERFERLQPGRLVPLLQEMKDTLRKNDPDYVNRKVPEHATAVSSEGELHPDAPEAGMLTKLAKRLDGIIGQPRYEEAQSLTIRILGSCSAGTPRLMKVLRKCLAWPGTIEQQHLWALGNCLREPDDVRTFGHAMLKNLASDRPKGPNDWMRAMCRILQYRKQAAEELESDECTALSRECLEFMRAQVAGGAARYLYRHASLCIVYLLRRRRFDDSYMDPKGQLAKQIKQTFRAAIIEFKAGRLRAIGGFVDLPHVTQMMIDYIDRRGRGRLVGLSPG